MDWITRLKNGEAELKELVDRLAQSQGASPCAQVERAYLMRSLAAKLLEMRSFVEDCLAGRNTHERSLLEYRVRVEFPLYSHLDTLSSMSRSYVDWTESGLPSIPARASGRGERQAAPVPDPLPVTAD
jgi:hypothetical protein